MSVAGKWNVTMNTPIGTLKFVWDLTNEGAQWRGQMTGEAPVGNSELSAINVQGDALSFETTAQSPMGALKLAFSGTAAGDAMQGVCKTKFGDNRFSAQRA